MRASSVATSDSKRHTTLVDAFFGALVAAVDLLGGRGEVAAMVSELAGELAEIGDNPRGDFAEIGDVAFHPVGGRRWSRR